MSEDKKMIAVGGVLLSVWFCMYGIYNFISSQTASCEETDATNVTEETVLETEETYETLYITETTCTETVTETVEENVYNTDNVLVYKPSTNYVHKPTCFWYDYTCKEIDLKTFDISSVNICTDCNAVEFINVDKTTDITEDSNNIVNNLDFVRKFDRGTYYPGTAFSSDPYSVNGGSGRRLIGYGNYAENIKGSIASKFLYNNFGYKMDGERSKFYIEVPSYPEMNGWYYLDDCSGSDCVDFFVYNDTDCPFYGVGVVTVNVYK